MDRRCSVTKALRSKCASEKPLGSAPSTRDGTSEPPSLVPASKLGSSQLDGRPRCTTGTRNRREKERSPWRCCWGRQFGLRGVSEQLSLPPPTIVVDPCLRAHIPRWARRAGNTAVPGHQRPHLPKWTGGLGLPTFRSSVHNSGGYLDVHCGNRWAGVWGLRWIRNCHCKTTEEPRRFPPGNMWRSWRNLLRGARRTHLGGRRSHHHARSSDRRFRLGLWRTRSS